MYSIVYISNYIHTCTIQYHLFCQHMYNSLLLLITAIGQVPVCICILKVDHDEIPVQSWFCYDKNCIGIQLLRD